MHHSPTFASLLGRQPLWAGLLITLVCGSTSAQGRTSTSVDALQGEWLCHTAATPSQATHSHYVSIDRDLLQTDTIDADMRLTPAGPHRYTGTWVSPDTSAPSSTRQLELVNADTLRYTEASTSPVSATCQRTTHPAPPTAQAPAANWRFIQLADARPTQPAVGYDQIYAKQARYRDTQAGSDAWKKSFDDWCQLSGLQGVRKQTVTTASRLSEPESFACKKTAAQRDIAALKTAVIGPGGQIYMTDGHHSLSSLWEAPVQQGDARKGQVQGHITLPVRIQADYSQLNNASFWRAMRKQGYTWLYEPDGSPAMPATLPRQMGLQQGLKDDPYRSLVYFTRQVGQQTPEDAPEFAEFHWAHWLQAVPQNFRLNQYQLDRLGAGNGSDRGYLQAVHDAALLMTQAPAQAMIGLSGKDAQHMGQMRAINTPALQALVQRGQAPGKLAQAVRYRQSQAQAPQ